jgi:hypothetical protein
MKEFFASSVFAHLTRILAILLIALVIFWAGMAVGYRKAQFAYHWDDHYADQFGGAHSPFATPPGMTDPDTSPDSHGATGEIVTVSLPVVVVKGQDEPEKEILIGTSTPIRRYHDVVASTTLRAGDTVVVIGEPNDQGQIQASFVRVFASQ